MEIETGKPTLPALAAPVKPASKKNSHRHKKHPRPTPRPPVAPPEPPEPDIEPDYEKMSDHRLLQHIKTVKVERTIDKVLLTVLSLDLSRHIADKAKQARRR